MRKALIFILAIFVGLLASSVQGANLLKNTQYHAIKTLNIAFFEEYKKVKLPAASRGGFCKWFAK